MTVKAHVAFYLFVLAALCLGQSAPLHAQEKNFFVSNEGDVALLTGEIVDSTVLEFATLLLERPNLKVLVLDSPGGLVVPALKIAAAVDKIGISTFIPEQSVCASACALIYFAGYERIAKGKLGVHQMYNTSASGVQLLLAQTLDAFERYGVHRRISQTMLITLPDDMYFFTEEDKVELRINRSASEHITSQPTTRSKARVDFSSYPAFAPFPAGRAVTLPDFAGRDKWARSYRTRIRNGLSEGPNFAGHYSLIVIGCGLQCRFAYVADANTGEVFDFPYGGEPNRDMTVLFNLSSRLVKVTYISEASSAMCVQTELLFNGRSFEVLGETTYPAVDWSCDS